MLRSWNWLMIGFIFIGISGCNDNTENDDRDTNRPLDGNQTMLKGSLKKTGQMYSFDVSGYMAFGNTVKDDGYYKKGAAPSYTRDANISVVIDNIRELMWQDDDSTIEANNLEEAKKFCTDDFNAGGYEDWRLPSYAELSSIVDYGKSSPSIDPVFQNVSASSYWTSTAYSADSRKGWCVSFKDGNDNSNDVNNIYFIRCVRDVK